MTILPLIQLERANHFNTETALRQPTKDVVDFGPECQWIVDDLVNTLLVHRIAVGLAAPQIGVALRIAVINVSKDKKEPTLIICNPRILSSTGKKDRKIESCMSIPGYGGEVERRDKVEISYQSRTGEAEVLQARGFLARVIAHEIDHLDGVLYIDRMTDKSLLKPVDLFERD